MPINSRACRESLNDLSAAIVNAGAQALRAAVKDAESSAKSTALFKDKTGDTRKSIDGTADGFSGRLVAKGAATFLENGTRPHVISGKRGGLLRFVMNGRTVFARSVHHPGTAERPFMTIARDLGEQSLEHTLDFLVTSAIERSR